MKPLLAAALLALSPLSVARAGSFLIVPGHSIGHASLGLDGSRALAAKPTASDASMGGSSVAVWRAKNGRDTLFIHTHRNDMNAPPKPGYSVLEVRVTSPRFHTRSGLAPGSTLADIRRRYPEGHLTTVSGSFYAVPRRGVAFEFAAPPAAASRCLAVTVCPRGEADGFPTAAQVKGLLDESR